MWKIEAARFLETTLTVYQSTRLHVAEDVNRHQHSCAKSDRKIRNFCSPLTPYYVSNQNRTSLEDNLHQKLKIYICITHCNYGCNPCIFLGASG
jgi:hypothetical protein